MDYRYLGSVFRGPITGATIGYYPSGYTSHRCVPMTAAIANPFEIVFEKVQISGATPALTISEPAPDPGGSSIGNPISKLEVQSLDKGSGSAR